MVACGIMWIGTRKQVIRKNPDMSKKVLCIKCGYDLRGNVSGICPECGTEMLEEQRRAIVEAGK
jgi:predicted Zn-ribbon and HTH transcriptional regulator